MCGNCGLKVDLGMTSAAEKVQTFIYPEKPQFNNDVQV